MASAQARRAAVRVQHVADEARRLADQAARAGSVNWQSTSSEGFRRRLEGEVARMRRAAGRLDEAALELRRHAAAIDQAGHGFGLSDRQ